MDLVNADGHCALQTGAGGREEAQHRIVIKHSKVGNNQNVPVILCPQFCGLSPSLYEPCTCRPSLASKPSDCFWFFCHELLPCRSPTTIPEGGTISPPPPPLARSGPLDTPTAPLSSILSLVHWSPIWHTPLVPVAAPAAELAATRSQHWTKTWTTDLPATSTPSPPPLPTGS